MAPLSLFQRTIKGIFNYGLGKILPKLLNFLLFPLYTIYLTPTDFGIVELVVSLTAFLIPLSRLGMIGSITRFYFEYLKKPKLLADMVTTILRVMIASSICNHNIISYNIKFFWRYIGSRCGFLALYSIGIRNFFVFLFSRKFKEG